MGPGVDVGKLWVLEGSPSGRGVDVVDLAVAVEEEVCVPALRAVVCNAAAFAVGLPLAPLPLLGSFVGQSPCLC